MAAIATQHPSEQPVYSKPCDSCSERLQPWDRVLGTRQASAGLWPRYTSEVWTSWPGRSLQSAKTLRPSKSYTRKCSLNILHCAPSPKSFIFACSKLIVCLPVKADSRTAKGVQRYYFCGKNEAEWKDTEEDNRKQNFQALCTHTALGKMTETSSSFFVPPHLPNTKCKSREKGALMTCSSIDVPSCCLSEPYRHTDGGRK